MVKKKNVIIVDDEEDNDWRFVDGYGERYKVYRDGRVFEVKGGEEKKVEPFVHKTGLWFVTFIRNGGHSNSHSVARLVWEAFEGKIKDGTKLFYKDGNSGNYKLENLEVKSKREKIHEIPKELDKTKEWKPLKGYEEFYKISDHGDIYSIRINKMVSPALGDKGYYTVTLNKNGSRRGYLVHRLVFETFKGSLPEKGKVVDHIDRNKKNNFIDNLREASRTENAKNIDKKEYSCFEKIIQYNLDGTIIKEWNSCKEIIENNPEYKKDSINHCCVGNKKTAYGFVWKYKDYVYNQIGFVQVKTDDGKTYSNYKINKEGIVINQNGRVIKPSMNEYCCLSIVSDCGKAKGFHIHRLVAITFLPNPENKSYVNHKDENKLNNNVDNLEWSTAQENSHHSLSKKVHKIDRETGEILGTYDSITNAFKSLNRDMGKGNQWGIGRACNGKSETAYGYKWKFA